MRDLRDTYWAGLLNWFIQTLGSHLLSLSNLLIRLTELTWPTYWTKSIERAIIGHKLWPLRAIGGNWQPIRQIYGVWECLKELKVLKLKFQKSNIQMWSQWLLGLLMIEFWWSRSVLLLKGRSLLINELNWLRDRFQLISLFDVLDEERFEFLNSNCGESPETL